jgi:hypothetical protein
MWKIPIAWLYDNSPTSVCLRGVYGRDHSQDFKDMLDLLRAKEYDALVLDSAVLEYTVGTNEECDLFVIGEPFETFSLALAFPADFDDAVVYALSSSIVALQVGSKQLPVVSHQLLAGSCTDPMRQLTGS